MTRDEWNALHHTIRADARAFKAKHGGGPCFGRHFMHRGAEILLRRAFWAPGVFKTDVTQSAIIDRPKMQRHAQAMTWAADYRKEARQIWKRETAKRAHRATIEEARHIRLAA